MAGCQGCPLNKIDIQVTVIIVVDQRDTGTHNFRQQVLAGCAGEVPKLQPRFQGGVPKECGWSEFGFAGRLCTTAGENGCDAKRGPPRRHGRSRIARSLAILARRSD